LSYAQKLRTKKIPEKDVYSKINVYIFKKKPNLTFANSVTRVNVLRKGKCVFVNFTFSEQTYYTT
jgi:hypothetical protein